MSQDEDTPLAPLIIPCYHGQELDINQELVTSGLSAISIKHKKSTPLPTNKGQDKLMDTRFHHRNSFWNLHRPELTKLNWTPFSQRKIEQFFHEHSTKHGNFCSDLHLGCKSSPIHEPIKEIHNPSQIVVINDDDDVPYHLTSDRSVQLSDEDLHPVNVIHKSRAQISVTMGCTEVSPLTRSTSSQVPTIIQKVPTERKGSLPTEHENLLSNTSTVDTNTKNKKIKNKTQDTSQNDVSKTHHSGLNKSSVPEYHGKLPKNTAALEDKSTHDSTERTQNTPQFDNSNSQEYEYISGKLDSNESLSNNSVDSAKVDAHLKILLEPREEHRASLVTEFDKDTRNSFKNSGEPTTEI